MSCQDSRSEPCNLASKPLCNLPHCASLPQRFLFSQTISLFATSTAFVSLTLEGMRRPAEESRGKDRLSKRTDRLCARRCGDFTFNSHLQCLLDKVVISIGVIAVILSRSLPEHSPSTLSRKSQQPLTFINMLPGAVLAQMSFKCINDLHIYIMLTLLVVAALVPGCRLPCLNDAFSCRLGRFLWSPQSSDQRRCSSPSFPSEADLCAIANLQC